jgi:hypothetical protein
MVKVEGRLRRLHEDSDLGNADVTVAAENERLIGFGILRKERDGGCVSLFEDGRRKGIGASIVRHLMEYADITKVPPEEREFSARSFSRSGPHETGGGMGAADSCGLSDKQKMRRIALKKIHAPSYREG